MALLCGPGSAQLPLLWPAVLSRSSGSQWSSSLQHQPHQRGWDWAADWSCLPWVTDCKGNKKDVTPAPCDTYQTWQPLGHVLDPGWLNSQHKTRDDHFTKHAVSAPDPSDTWEPRWRIIKILNDYHLLKISGIRFYILNPALSGMPTQIHNHINHIKGKTVQ